MVHHNAAIYDYTIVKWGLIPTVIPPSQCFPHRAGVLKIDAVQVYTQSSLRVLYLTYGSESSSLGCRTLKRQGTTDINYIST